MYGPIPAPLEFLHVLGPFLYPLLALLIIWELVIKGFGLWRAARNADKGWFILILLLNTVGILPLIYILWFGKKKETAAPAESSSPEA